MQNSFTGKNRQNNKPNVFFRCGVALDTWMLPLDEEIFPSIKQPIFFINSEKFQWIGNIIRMKKLDSAVIPRKMITIRSVIHIWISNLIHSEYILCNCALFRYVLAEGLCIRASLISHFLLVTLLEGSWTWKAILIHILLWIFPTRHLWHFFNSI